MKICPNCGFKRIFLNRKQKEAFSLFSQQRNRYKPLDDAFKKSKDWCAICIIDLMMPIAEEMLRKSEWSGKHGGYVIDF